MSRYKDRVIIKMKDFNLIDEAWIPVRMGGEAAELGLREVILRAHEIERLEDPSPLVEVALFRLLLAVVHRALEGPANTADLLALYQAGSFPASAVDGYLRNFQERFWLFHPEAPFYQVADLPTDDVLPWTKLRPDVASGNNPTLFSHAHDDTPQPASYAEAARHLLAHQTFTPGGLIRRLGVTSGVDAPLARAAAFVPQGNNLFESLTYSLVPYRPEGDQPIWEAPPIKTADLQADASKRPQKKLPYDGRTRVFTWFSRAVKLLPENGQVLYMGYGPGVDPISPEQYTKDPHVAYRRNKDRLLPVRLRQDRAFWRDFTSLYPKEGAGIPPAALETAARIKTQLLQPDPLPLAVLGQVTDQAKVLEIRRELYPVPASQSLAALGILIERALEAVEKTASCLSKAGWVTASRLLSLDPNRKPDSGEVRALIDSFPLLPRYYQVLGLDFPAFLARAEEDPEAAYAYWLDAVQNARRAAWRETRAAIGTEARALKAIQEGERTLYSCIKKEVSE